MIWDGYAHKMESCMRVKCPKCGEEAASKNEVMAALSIKGNRLYMRIPNSCVKYDIGFKQEIINKMRRLFCIRDGESNNDTSDTISN